MIVSGPVPMVVLHRLLPGRVQPMSELVVLHRVHQSEHLLVVRDQFVSSDLGVQFGELTLPGRELHVLLLLGREEGLESFRVQFVPLALRELPPLVRYLEALRRHLVVPLRLDALLPLPRRQEPWLQNGQLAELVRLVAGVFPGGLESFGSVVFDLALGREVGVHDSVETVLLDVLESVGLFPLFQGWLVLDELDV